jgi:hypothetical protein
MDWATFWAIFSQTHRVTLASNQLMQIFGCRNDFFETAANITKKKISEKKAIFGMKR